MTLFADVVRARAEDDKVGLVFEDRSWTWREVVAEACVRAAALSRVVPVPEGRQRHLGILLENVPDYVFWLLAGAMNGTTVVGLNASRSAAELAADIDNADIDVIVTEERLRHLLVDADIAADRVSTIDSDTHAAWLGAHAGAGLPTETPQGTDIALLLFSSGTTGTPKAVIVGQERLGTLVTKIVDRISLRRDSVTYLCMPLFHGNAIIMNLAPALVIGATVTLARKFSATRFAGDIHHYGVTYLNYVGRALSYVLNHPADPRDADSTLELAYGTEASEADIRRFGERFGCVVMEGYGLTEGVFRIGRTPDTPPGSLGRPQEGTDVRVMDENTGEECPRAEFTADGRLANPEAVGQMVAVGLAHLFEGYYHNPQAVADRVRGADFWSGDLGYRDADGWFYFAGRSSDWIRVDGENFASAQVERVLQRAPGVLSAPSFAIADPRTGDLVMCGVEMEAGATFDADEFASFLAAQPDMGAKWWPAFVRIVQQLPLTGSGKLDKAPLRRAAWQSDDDVYMRVGRTAEYRLMSPDDKATLVSEFLTHGRAALLPA
ncbi:AMP-binding protein [Microbacterium sp. YY-03]|uniref:AMP-binding protein n=1 Tax=Microbacterium sp. YY-03 TaxID=3421636 RepID=UPI003D17A5C1